MVGQRHGRGAETETPNSCYQGVRLMADTASHEEAIGRCRRKQLVQDRGLSHRDQPSIETHRRFLPGTSKPMSC